MTTDRTIKTTAKHHPYTVNIFYENMFLQQKNINNGKNTRDKINDRDPKIDERKVIESMADQQ